MRSENGQRLYSDAEVDRLSLLAKAARAGRSLSETAPLSSAELRQLVSKDANLLI